MPWSAQLTPIHTKRKEYNTYTGAYADDWWVNAFFYAFLVGFVGRTSRRHPKRTRRSPAKSCGNGKGSFHPSWSSSVASARKWHSTLLLILSSFAYITLENVPYTFDVIPLSRTGDGWQSVATRDDFLRSSSAFDPRMIDDVSLSLFSYILFILQPPFSCV